MLGCWSTLFALFWGTAHVVAAQSHPPPTVYLSTGKVIGITNTTTKLDRFLGIPFARPPLGDLRFAAPVPLPRNASKVIHATKFGPDCLQVPSVSVTTQTYQ